MPEPAPAPPPASPVGPTGAGALAVRWVVLAAAVGALHIAGRGPLALPHLDRLVGWSRGTTPVDVAFVAVRVAALGAGLYLWAAVTLALVASLVRSAGMAAVALRLVPASARQLLALAATTTVVSAGLAFGPAASAAPTGVGAGPPTLTRLGARPTTAHAAGPASPRVVGSPTPPTLRRLTPSQAEPGAPTPARSAPTPPSTSAPPGTTMPPGTTTPVTAAPPSSASPPRPAPSGAASSRPVTPSPRTPSPTATTPTTATTSPAATPSGAAGTAPGGTWTVAPGDSFWSIAATRIGATLAQPPSTQQIADYWADLVAANWDRLPVPGQPDLLFPGDRLVLPPIPDGAG